MVYSYIYVYCICACTRVYARDRSKYPIVKTQKYIFYPIYTIIKPKNIQKNVRNALFKLVETIL